MKKEQSKSGCVVPLVVLVVGFVMGFSATMLAHDGRQAPTSAVVTLGTLMAIGFVVFNGPDPFARIVQFSVSFAMGGLLLALIR